MRKYLAAVLAEAFSRVLALGSFVGVLFLALAWALNLGLVPPVWLAGVPLGLAAGVGLLVLAERFGDDVVWFRYRRDLSRAEFWCRRG